MPGWLDFRLIGLRYIQLLVAYFSTESRSRNPSIRQPANEPAHRALVFTRCADKELCPSSRAKNVQNGVLLVVLPDSRISSTSKRNHFPRSKLSASPHLVQMATRSGAFCTKRGTSSQCEYRFADRRRPKPTSHRGSQPTDRHGRARQEHPKTAAAQSQADPSQIQCSNPLSEFWTHSFNPPSETSPFSHSRRW